MGKNEGKNEPVAPGKQFTSEYQPSPKAKSKGWERRREARKIMDEIMKLADMPYSEIKELLNDIQKNPDKHTLREVKLANYLMEKKYTVDYLDRHISKAPQDIDITTNGNDITAIDVKIIDTANEARDESDQNTPEDNTSSKEG